MSISSLLRSAQKGTLSEAELQAEIDQMSDDEVMQGLQQSINPEKAEQLAREILEGFDQDALNDVFASVHGGSAELEGGVNVIDAIIASAAQQTDMLTFLLTLIELEDAIQPLASLRRADKPGGRYAPKTGPEYWSPETQPVTDPHQNLYRTMPGSPEIKPEVERIRKTHPRTTQEPSRLGPGPVSPASMVEVPEDPGEQAELFSTFKEDIIQNLQPQGAMGMPRPYTMEMVYQYFTSIGDAKSAEKYRIDGVRSISRFGFSTKHLIERLTENMSMEELYVYWNSIVNSKMLPYVNPDWVDWWHSLSDEHLGNRDRFKEWTGEEAVVEEEPVPAELVEEPTTAEEPDVWPK